MWDDEQDNLNDLGLAIHNTQQNDQDSSLRERWNELDLRTFIEEEESL